MRNAALLCGVFLLMSLTTRGQTFSSGSTGADGALDLTSGSLTLQLPDSGVFNFTTVNVPSGRTLNFTRNLRNTPVIILAQGSVNVGGEINLGGGCSGDCPTIGGFSGGAFNQPGFGPGGGQPSPGDTNGKWVGPLSLVPIIGGSGGASSGGAGNGGGAIVVASSTSITVSGRIFANGNCGATGSCSTAGNGSGGAIRLVANSVTVTSSGLLRATSNAGAAYHGIIRIEATSGAFAGTSTPAPILSTTINPVIVANSNTPSLTITSIAGFLVPSNPAARSDLVDLMLPSQLTDPISVVVRGHNIPVGTQVKMAVGGSSATTTTANLSGTLDSSSATLTVSGLSRTSASTLFVFATFSAPSGAQAFNPRGRNHVARIRVGATLGGTPKLAFLRADGTEIDAAKLSPEFLKQFKP